MSQKSPERPAIPSVDRLLRLEDSVALIEG